MGWGAACNARADRIISGQSLTVRARFPCPCLLFLPPFIEACRPVCLS